MCVCLCIYSTLENVDLDQEMPLVSREILPGTTIIDNTRKARKVVSDYQFKLEHQKSHRSRASIYRRLPIFQIIQKIRSKKEK